MTELNYWLFDLETRIVEQTIYRAYIDGGDVHFPMNCLKTKPLSEKQGFAVIAKSDLSGTEYIEDHREKTVYKKTDRSTLEIKELGAIPDGYTLLEPQQFDEWVNDKWVTNEITKYEYEWDVCDSNRRSAYSNYVDPLIHEANIKRLQNNIVEAEKLEQKALQERTRIQAENPYPAKVNI